MWNQDADCTISLSLYNIFSKNVYICICLYGYMYIYVYVYIVTEYLYSVLVELCLLVVGLYVVLIFSMLFIRSPIIYSAGL